MRFGGAKWTKNGCVFSSIKCVRFFAVFWVDVFCFSACFSDLFVAISTGNFEWISTGFSSKFRWQNADQGHFDTAKVTLSGVLLCLVLGSGGFWGWVFFLSIFSRRFFVC